MIPGEKIPNPLPDPVQKPHRAMDFDLGAGDTGEGLVFHEDPEDDFDYRISDGDDFDIE